MLHGHVWTVFESHRIPMNPIHSLTESPLNPIHPTSSCILQNAVLTPSYNHSRTFNQFLPTRPNVASAHCALQTYPMPPRAKAKGKAAVASRPAASGSWLVANGQKSKRVFLPDFLSRPDASRPRRNVGARAALLDASIPFLHRILTHFVFILPILLLFLVVLVLPPRPSPRPCPSSSSSCSSFSSCCCSSSSL